MTNEGLGLFAKPKRRIIECTRTSDRLEVPIPFDEITFFDVLAFGEGRFDEISGIGGFYMDGGEIKTGKSIQTTSVPIRGESIFLRDYKQVSDFVYEKYGEVEIDFFHPAYSRMAADIHWRLSR